MIAWFLSGCFVLDGFIHNPVHCSTVSDDTCASNPWDAEWDAICLTCEEPYDWAEEHPWMEGTLAPGQTVRPVLEGAFTDVQLETTDGLGELDLVWFYSHGEDAAVADLTVIYNHGNYAGLEHYAPRVRFLVEAGFNVVAWDYRGYGKSQPPTAPSTDQLLEDARQVRAFVAEQGVDDSKVIVYTYSVGGIPGLEMVLEQPACALIWEAGFTGVGPMTTANTGTSFGGAMLSTGKLENTDRIRDWDGPLLVMIGTEDQSFSVDDQRALFENAPGPKAFWEVDGAHHGIGDKGIPEHAGLTTYFAQLKTFLADEAEGCQAP